MSLLGFKTKLDPNNEQRTKFWQVRREDTLSGDSAAQHAGVARYTYNWGLDICQEAINERIIALEKGLPVPKFPTAIDLHKKLNAEVKPELKWFYESCNCAPQQALRDLDNAWKRFLKVPISGSPKRKKKHRNDHFYLDGAIQIKDGLALVF